LLYQVIEEYWPEFQAELASQGKHLPNFICREFDEYLKCGWLEYGILRVRCESCHDEKSVAFSCKRLGLLRASCPSPFGPAFGCSKSLPAILSAQVVAHDAWSLALLCW
jgi:hypothetical protein